MFWTVFFASLLSQIVGTAIAAVVVYYAQKSRSLRENADADAEREAEESRLKQKLDRLNRTQRP